MSPVSLQLFRSPLALADDPIETVSDQPFRSPLALADDPIEGFSEAGSGKVRMKKMKVPRVFFHHTRYPMWILPLMAALASASMEFAFGFLDCALRNSMTIGASFRNHLARSATASIDLDSDGCDSPVFPKLNLYRHKFLFRSTFNTNKNSL